MIGDGKSDKNGDDRGGGCSENLRRSPDPVNGLMIVKTGRHRVEGISASLGSPRFLLSSLELISIRFFQSWQSALSNRWRSKTSRLPCASAGGPQTAAVTNRSYG